jgi:pyrroline-5-carboxylate reductase
MKIAIIGAGEMGGAFAEGLLKGSIFKPSDVTVANRHEGKLDKFAKMGASITTDNKAAVEGADYVVVVVKPGVVKTVIDEIKPVLDYSRQTILNMAASITISQLKTWLDKDALVPRIFQVLPNVGIAERASMTFIAPDDDARDQLPQVNQIFEDLGQTMLTDEKMLVAGTALSGCGIAYAMRYVRAASEAGVELGFNAAQAKDIILQTLEGAVSLLKATGKHPEAAIDMVTTPGGMTIRGLNAMEKNGFSNAVIEGIKAALK